MTQSAMKRKVLNGVGGLIKKAPHVFEAPTIDDTVVGNSTANFALSYTCTGRDLVYLTSDFKWAKADADGATALYSNLLGIVMEDGVDGDFVLVALPGSMIYAATAFPTCTGLPLYMSATAGAITETAPVLNLNAVRVVGYGIGADKIWFDPAPVSFVNGSVGEIALPTVSGSIVGPQTSLYVSGYTTSAIGDAVSLNSSSKWVLMDANTSSLCSGLTGICMSVGATDVAIKVALPGSFIKTAATYTAGTDYFISETAGALTSTKPTTGTSSQIIAVSGLGSNTGYVRMTAAVTVSGA